MLDIQFYNLKLITMKSNIVSIEVSEQAARIIESFRTREVLDVQSDLCQAFTKEVLGIYSKGITPDYEELFKPLLALADYASIIEELPKTK